MDGREDATEQGPADSYLGQLEREGTDVADNACPDFDQPACKLVND